MKRLLFRFIFLAYLCSGSLSLSAYPYEAEGKVGIFIPTTKRISEIFPAMPFLEVEGRYRFDQCWEVWSGVGWIYGVGNSQGCKNRTTVQVVPFTLGVRQYICIAPTLDAFLGLGGVWSLYSEHDHSPDLHQHISKNQFGGIIQGGLQHCFAEGIFFTCSVEYLYQKFSFHKVYEEHFTYRHDVNMSGVKVGCGIVYDF